MKLLPIVLLAAAALVLLLAMTRISSIKRYNRKHRRRRKPKRVDLLTILMFPLAAGLIAGALLIPGGETPSASNPGNSQETPSETDETEPEQVGGWKEDSGIRYYLNEDGSYAIGWMDLDGKRYHFNEDGIMSRGWTEVDGLTYYFCVDGAMARGEVEIDGVNHHFDSRGQRLILANPWNPVPDDYEPDLVELSSQYAVENCRVDSSCYDDLIAMIDACNANVPTALVVSAYRDFDHQTRNYNRKVNYYLDKGYSQADAEREAATEVAVPGTSEHQLGLAVDIIDTRLWDLTSEQANQPAQKWLMENSWQYGFIFRYPNEKIDITGIIYEPWHYRYVGRELAEEIYNSGLTLEEYLNSLS